MAEQAATSPDGPSRRHTDSTMSSDPSVTVTIRYFAAARAAAGVAEEVLAVAPRPSTGRLCTVADVLDAASNRHGPALARVLLRCSYLLDEVAVHGRDTGVRDGQLLDVLPPFAGG